MKCEICKKSKWIKKDLIAKCQQCGLVRATEKYFTINHSTIYQNTYYLGGDYFNYKLEKSALQKNFSNRLTKIKKYINNGKLLEIGSAYGFFLQLAKADFDVEGVETVSRIAQKSKQQLNIPIWEGMFETINFKNKYDAIVALDTIEHISSPAKFIQKCYQTLNSKGYLFLETGNIDSRLAKIQGKKWRLIHPPEHLWYFSPKTLSILLEKHSFKILSFEYVNFWRTGTQTLYRLFPNLTAKLNPKIIQLLYKIIYPLNTYDLFFLIAQKQN